MRKIVIHSPGGYEKLRIEEFPDPVPGENEVVVQTVAAGVNYADCSVRWGVYESAKKFVGWPITPGFEFSGVIVARGKKAKHKLGTKVFGVSLFNSYATHVSVPEHQVYPLPKKLTAIQAAAFPAVHMTAYHALFQLVRIRASGKILVHSAAGGVGSALLQLARIAGLESVAVVGGAHKVAFAKDFGAHAVIDKSSENLWQRARDLAPEGYDAILDANGYTTLKESYAQLAPTGKLIVYGSHSLLPKKGGRINYFKAGWGLLRTPRFNPLRMLSENKTVSGFNISFLFSRRDLLDEAMTDLLRWLAAGKLRPPAVTEVPFENAAEAHRLIESGKSVGKIVLVH
ncbi:MAG: zinc-binding dehydrogenase [Spirochaetes bacterium]|nr:zinc-binding dehydrogenase [Spirochaetota bacterium]